MSGSNHDFSSYHTATKFLYRLRYSVFWLSEKVNYIKLLDYIVLLVKEIQSTFKFYFIKTIRRRRPARILYYL
jgi:hypothetical protein